MPLKFYSLQSMASNKFTLPSAGVSNLKDSDIASTTGSPSVATYTSGGVDYKTYAFTGSGSITLNKAGYADVMLIGGGGSGGQVYGGGGGAGLLVTQTIVLPSGSSNITVGAGGAYSTNGNVSGIGIVAGTGYLITAIGGGSGGWENGSGYSGACSGGSGKNIGGNGGYNLVNGFGTIGGNGATNACGGGGGMGGNGSSASTNVSGNGGAAVSNTFRTGSSISYCGGGGAVGYSYSGVGGGGGAGNGGNYADSATANSGSGGGGGAAAHGFGGSGLVVIRVRA